MRFPLPVATLALGLRSTVAQAALAGQENVFYAMQCFSIAYLTNF